MIAWPPTDQQMFARAEALATQRAQLLELACRPGCATPRKLRRDARAVESIIVGIGELAEMAARRERKWGAA